MNVFGKWKSFQCIKSQSNERHGKFLSLQFQLYSFFSCFFVLFCSFPFLPFPNFAEETHQTFNLLFAQRK